MMTKCQVKEAVNERDTRVINSRQPKNDIMQISFQPESELANLADGIELGIENRYLQMSEITENIGTTIRNIRKSANLSIHELAKRASLSDTCIWKIEKGQMSPSVVVLYQVSRGLGVKITELLDPLNDEQQVIYTALGSRKAVTGPDLIMNIVSGSSRTMSIQAVEYTMKKGAKSGRKNMTHRGEEWAMCLEGCFQFLIDGKPYNLEAGDAIHFKSHLPHSWHNISNKVSKMLSITVPPR
jgi:transcriptional regulator with XRE-family HTH domain